jgi:hypothetical protein
VRTRLEDLIATAERQLASRSFDAAIDTYRTALSEPGAAEAGVEERLTAACRARDEARGIVRPVVASAPPAPSPPPPPPPIEIAPPPAPAPERVKPFRTIEPPTFRLLEPEESIMEGRGRQDYQHDFEKLSIVDPQSQPEDRDPLFLMRVGIAALIFVFVCLLVLILR